MGMYWAGAGIPFEAQMLVPAEDLAGLRGMVIAAVDQSVSAATLEIALSAAAAAYGLRVDVQIADLGSGVVASASFAPASGVVRSAAGRSASDAPLADVPSPESRGRTMADPDPPWRTAGPVDGPRTERRLFMHAFIVTLVNQPGTLADVTEAIAARGVDLATGAGFAMGDGGGFAFIPNDEAGARAALDGAGIPYREIEIVPASVPNRAGGLAEIARRLADAGVNVELVMPTGMADGNVTIAIGTSDPERARSVVASAETETIPA